MLAFDLETTGLDPLKDRITCAGVYDPEEGISRVFVFATGDDPEEFMCHLDRAKRLCAFNGASFDLGFIAAQLGPRMERVAAWRLKLHDVFVACKWGLGITFPLQALLEHNRLPGKTGQGCDAIELAMQQRWTELGNYCLNDTRMTHQVSSLSSIVIPRSRGVTLTVDGLFNSVNGC
jgi:hypothetical protein